MSSGRTPPEAMPSGRTSARPVSPAETFPARQRTVRRPVQFSGIGLHSGRRIQATVRPAATDAGIVFRRIDLSPAVPIPARWDAVCNTQLCTVLADASGGATVGTVEHLMAALAAAGIDNALIDIDGPEVPAMDGSARIFLGRLELTGTAELDAPRRGIRILKPVAVPDGPCRAALLPDEAFAVSMEIDFPDALIGRQHYAFRMSEAAFAAEIAPARTFGFLHEVTRMRSMGLALGGSLDNAVVVDSGRVLNEGGLRYPDEFVRHKILDIVGDLALAGAPILGRFEGVQSGHRLNNELLRALFADDDAWTPVELPSSGPADAAVLAASA